MHNSPDVRVQPVREGFNNPSHGNCPLGRSPPGAITDDIFPKVNGKGEYSPPLHGRSVAKKLTEKGGTPPNNRNFFAENGVFGPKNTVFGPIFNGFFLNGRSVPKNLTEKS